MEYNPRQAYFNRAWKQFEAYNNNSEGIYMECLTPDYSNVLNGYTITPIANGSCRLCPSKKFLDLFQDNDGRYKAFFRDTYYANRRKKKATSGPYKNQQVYVWTENDAKRYNLDLTRVNNDQFYIPLNDTCVYISKKKLTEADRNSRRYATYNVDDNYADQTQPKRFFPSLKKMDAPKYYAGSNASKPYSYADCIIYRLGETYLLAAEAAWRLGKTDVALKRINAIRNRACIGHNNSMNLTTIDQETLLNEYALEMCGEWCRWQTLKRFRALAERISDFNPQITTFKDEYYLRPVNASEIDVLDNGSEYQNPGY
ncbi:MAG: RagB/SusD family nutrient uptake outer membrane protein [Prevotellaceae bacterium]|nr:RagB/SusD family nutrient uptake outer membrane protein [Prevotellaceae bacterium]